MHECWVYTHVFSLREKGFDVWREYESSSLRCVNLPAFVSALFYWTAEHLLKIKHIKKVSLTRNSALRLEIIMENDFTNFRTENVKCQSYWKLLSKYYNTIVFFSRLWRNSPAWNSFFIVTSTQRQIIFLSETLQAFGNKHARKCQCLVFKSNFWCRWCNFE